MEYVETIPVAQVANEMRTNAMKIKSAILNHTMPIGAVMREEGSTHDRIIIFKTRWEKYKRGEL